MVTAWCMRLVGRSGREVRELARYADRVAHDIADRPAGAGRGKLQVLDANAASNVDLQLKCIEQRRNPCHGLNIAIPARTRRLRAVPTPAPAEQ